MILIYTIFPNKKTSEKAISIILKNRLAVCINYWPIEAKYLWQGKIAQAKEWALIIKTVQKNYQKIEKLIKENNSYETPAILSLRVNQVEKKYLKWLEKEIK